MVFRQEVKDKMIEVDVENSKRKEDTTKLNSKVDDMELFILSKIKNSDNKFE